jgi:large subunit ribosomal protein L33
MGQRQKIILSCTVCRQRNYTSSKDKTRHPDRFEVKKFCRFCGAHTIHRETR